MPILGILASAQIGANSNAYQSIATQTVGAGGSSSITFSSIPSTYKNLQIRAMMRTNTTGVDAPYIRYNSDTGSNYTFHSVLGESVIARSQGVATTTGINIGAYWFGTLGSDPSVSVVDILDYANTDKYKTTRAFAGQNDAASYGSIGLSSGLWKSSTAINSITIYLSGSTTFSQYSSFALYGIKG